MPSPPEPPVSKSPTQDLGKNIAGGGGGGHNNQLHENLSNIHNPRQPPSRVRRAPPPIGPTERHWLVAQTLSATILPHPKATYEVCILGEYRSAQVKLASYSVVQVWLPLSWNAYPQNVSELSDHAQNVTANNDSRPSNVCVTDSLRCNRKRQRGPGRQERARWQGKIKCKMLHISPHP